MCISCEEVYICENRIYVKFSRSLCLYVTCCNVVVVLPWEVPLSSWPTTEPKHHLLSPKTATSLELRLLVNVTELLTAAACFDAALSANFLITIKCNLTNYTVVSAPTEILNLDKTLPKFRFPEAIN